MITLEKPVINYKKGYTFENIKERNRQAAKQIHKDLQEIKNNSIVPSYEAGKFIPRAKVLSKKIVRQVCINVIIMI